MNTEVTDYISSIEEPNRTRIAQLYDHARQVVPDAVEGMSYAMPALLYQGKGLISVMNTKKHIGVYPFGSVDDVADELAAAGLERTKGSIHLKPGQELPTELLDRLLRRRVVQITASQGS